MGENWKLTQDALDKFLHWLDPNQVEAGTKYELIRRHLIFILTRRGCWEPEDLADETINRVARRVVEGLAETYRGDPTPYLITVARNLYLEHLETRKRERESIQNLPDPEPPDPDKERPDGKEDRQSKIDDRKRLAQELGISVNALRIRAFRIRAVLEQCIADCLAVA